MRRRLFNVIAGASLVLCVATAVAHVRTRFVWDSFEKRTYRPAEPCLYQTFITGQDGLISVHGVRFLLPGQLPALPNGEWDATWKHSSEDAESPSSLPTWRGTMFSPPPASLWVTVGWTQQSLIGWAEHRVTVVRLWPIVAAFALPPVAWLTLSVARLYRGRSRRMDGRCPACGYDLRATPDRCPECGRVPEKAAEVPN